MEEYTKHYNRHYLELTIEVLNDNIEDLSTWSAFNNDLYNTEISNLQEALLELKSKI